MSEGYTFTLSDILRSRISCIYVGDICNSAAVGSAGFARPVQPIDVMWHSVALTGGQSLSLSKETASGIFIKRNA